MFKDHHGVKVESMLRLDRSARTVKTVTMREGIEPWIALSPLFPLMGAVFGWLFH